MGSNKSLFEDFPLREGFRLPDAYLRLVESGLPDIEPWWWLEEYPDSAKYWAETLAEQYPSRFLVPFAKDGGSDDVFCFDGEDLSGNPRVLYIHGFASPGWELRGETEDFDEWLLRAKANAAKFQAEDDQD